MKGGVRMISNILYMKQHISQQAIKLFKEYYYETYQLVDNEGDIHGRQHAYRVLLYSIIISLEKKIAEEYLEIICIAACCHDIGRRTDDIEMMHGMYSWRKLRRNLNRELSTQNSLILKYMIENHCMPDDTAYENLNNFNIEDKDIAKTLISILKDADGLDLVRLDCFDSSFLRNRESFDLVDVASTIYNIKDFLSILLETNEHSCVVTP